MTDERPDDDDWEELETITRVPRGSRPGASTRTEGFNRGPVIIEGTGERAQPEWMLRPSSPHEPDHEPEAAWAAGPYDDDGDDVPPLIPFWLQEMIEQVLEEAIRRGARAAADALRPRLQTLWSTRVLPGLRSARERIAARRAGAPTIAEGAASPVEHTEQDDAEMPEPVAEAALVLSRDVGSMSVSEALDRLDAAEAIRILSEYLRRLSDDERRAVAATGIDDPEARRAAEGLTPEQITRGITVELQRNPAMLGDIARDIDGSGAAFEGTDPYTA